MMKFLNFVFLIINLYGFGQVPKTGKALYDSNYRISKEYTFETDLLENEKLIYSENYIEIRLFSISGSRLDKNCIKLMWDSLGGWTSNYNDIGFNKEESKCFFIERPCNRIISQMQYERLFRRLSMSKVFQLKDAAYYSSSVANQFHCSHAPHWQIHFKVGNNFRAYSFMDPCIYEDSHKMEKNLKKHLEIANKLFSELFHEHYYECK